MSVLYELAYEGYMVMVDKGAWARFFKPVDELKQKLEVREMKKEVK